MTIHLHPPGLQHPKLQWHRASTKGRDGKFQLGWPGFDPVRPCLDIIDFDHSGSITAPGGNDPVGNRFYEAALAIENVKAWTISRGPKVAIIHFDQPSAANSGVVAIARRGSSRRLRGSLRRPIDAAGTSDLSPSLAAAEELAAAYADHDVRFTIFSDFALTDVDTDDVYQRLSNFPGRVFAVLLNAGAPRALIDTGITIARVSNEDAPGVLAAALHRSLTVNRRTARSRNKAVLPASSANGSNS